MGIFLENDKISQIFLHSASLPGRLVGYVDTAGNAYEQITDKERYIGRADLGTGRIFESRLAPDQPVGHVDLADGRIFLARLSENEPVATVQGNGAIILQLPSSQPELIGMVNDLASLAHGGAAFLLLIKPVMDARRISEMDVEHRYTDLEAGTAPSPAG